jgi:hypothetical protein
MAQLTIKKLGVLSVAKIYGAITFVFGLIIGVIYGLFVMVFGAAMMSQSRSAGGGAVFLGLVIMIVTPILYAVIGFIAGAIGALIYNVAAGIAGGIEIEVEGESQAYAAPPSPPQQWAANPYQQGQGY